MNEEDEIRKTLALYPKAADDRNAEAYSDLFTEDAILVSRSGVHFGRAAIKQFLIDLYAAQPLDRAYKHFFSNHVINIGGNTADVASDMVVFECLRENPWQVRTVVRHTDKLEAQPDGRWLFAFKHMQGTLYRRA